MYLRSAEIENIRSLKNFKLEFDPGKYAGWHVLIGDNGSGKTTLVRAIALALIGPDEAKALRQNWADWLRHEETLGKVEILIDSNPKIDKATGSGKHATDYFLSAAVGLRRTPSAHGKNVELVVRPYRRLDPKRYVWGKGEGWFCASYGPFRRFSGGNKDHEKLFYSNPRVARHLSAFGEDVALTECLDWLRTLHVKRLEGDRQSELLLDHLTQFLNEGDFLPHDTFLERVTSDAVVFRDGNGCHVSVEELSDGYRSVLSMTFELIRQMVHVYGRTKVFPWCIGSSGSLSRMQAEIMVPGVVLIDEIDAHLHPTWQRRIGRWFRKYFPRVQFIVTTHSPLVCQAAEEGSVWRLPTPGDDSTAGRVKGVELQRLIYGSVLEAFDTELFGPDITRSESSKEKLARLAKLNQRSLRAELTAEEKKELDELRATLPTMAGVLEDTKGEES